MRFPRISNATDAEALACEPGVAVRYVTEPSRVEGADLVVLPGSKATVADLGWLRRTGLADAVVAHAAAGRPVLGICGGYQMLGRRIADPYGVEAESAEGLGLLDLEVEFAADKVLQNPVGTAWGHPVRGYEIHHGRVVRSGDPVLLDGPGEGSDAGVVLGTHWHGLLENDGFRRALLARVAEQAGRTGFRAAPGTSFAAETGRAARSARRSRRAAPRHRRGAGCDRSRCAAEPPDGDLRSGRLPAVTSSVPRVAPDGRAVVRFPFSAVVGHDDLRLALLLNAVHPGVGGVLVRGEKGTAKSTAVRALAALLPDVAVVPDCRFSCDPAVPDPRCPDGPHAAPGPVVVRGDAPDRADAEVRRRDGLALLATPPSTVHARAARLVELPVGATEDRLVGSLDLERALAQGVRAYQPGLLAEAHRGVLYVDEVNLLHDHLVDLLLDAAAMGRAHVERDGVSVSHAASFLLVGTMNPEEGELRPQLLDRFGLTVEVRASRDVDTRVEVVRRRMAFEADPAAFAATFAEVEAATARRIADARARLASVVLPDAELRRIAGICASFDVDGMRADLVIARAAAAHAAWRGADAVAKEDVRAAARLALPHRRRRDPFDEPGMDEQALDEALDGADEEPEPGSRRPRSRRSRRRRAGARRRRRSRRSERGVG